MQIDKNGMTNDMMMKIYEGCLTGYAARYTTILHYKILPQVGILTTSCRDIIIIISGDSISSIIVRSKVRSDLFPYLFWTGGGSILPDLMSICYSI